MSQKKKRETLKEQVASKLVEKITPVEGEEPEKKEKLGSKTAIEVVDETHLKIETNLYTIVVNHRDAVQLDALSDRYNTILNKYDYIVGDWGYDQLRLKGFFSEEDRRAPLDKKITFLEDYLYEYCNFGCAYFVLEKEKTTKQKKGKSRRKKPQQTEEDAPQAQQQKTPAKKKDFVINNRDQKKNEDDRAKRKPQRKKNNQPNTQFQIRKKED